MPRTRIRQAALLSFCGALLAMAGCAPQGPLPQDAELIAFFHAHRADLDLLRDNGQASMRDGKDYDPALYQEWVRLIRKLDLPGGGSRESDQRILIPAARARRIGNGLIDVKGFAWIEFVAKGEPVDTLESLDLLDARAFQVPGRHLRHLEGHWWLYRQIAPPAED